MSGIRSLMNANAILWQKLRARFSGHAFNQDNRAPVSRVATHLDVPDRVSMQTGRLDQVPNSRSGAAGICAPVVGKSTNDTCGQSITRIATSQHQGGIQ
jgi:hypothetical protein